MEKPLKLLLIVMVPLLFSCSMRIAATSYQDRTIPPIPLTAASSIATWESPDLRITVKQSYRQGRATFTGEVALDSSITMSYPVVEKFSLALLILDQNGSVLTRNPLRLGIIHYQLANETYDFELQSSLPEKGVTYSFEYTGSFSDYGEIRPESIYIAYHPPQPSARADD